MRYAIIVTILAYLLCTFETKAQVYQSMPQAGYGPVKRMLIDSVLTIPIGISALRNITGGRDTAQIRYQKSDSSVYVYTGSTWVKLGTGGGGGGSADSTVFFTVYRADTMRANIYGSIPQPDTIYARYPVRISNDTIYLQQAFVDSVYSGGGGNFVPYTGATQDVDLGARKLSAASIFVEGTNGNGHIHLKHQTADATATGNSTSLYADTNGDIKWKNDGDYYTTLKTSGQTANRIYTYPDSSGTLALMSNVNLKANTVGPTFTDSLVLTSTVGGISLPNMTQTQMNAIVPRLGTQVYNTTYDAVCTYTNDFGWWSGERSWLQNNGLDILDDFISPAGLGGNFVAINSGGSISTTASLSNRPGVLNLSTGTGATGRGAIAYDNSSSLTILPGGGRIIISGTVMFPDLSSSTQTFNAYVGSTSAFGNVSTNAIAFLYDSAGTNTGSAASGRWQVVCSNLSSRSYTTTSVQITAGQYYNLKAIINAAGTQVDFYIDDVLVKSETNNIPASTNNLTTPICAIVKSNGTTARFMRVDWFRYRQKFTTPRS